VSELSMNNKSITHCPLPVELYNNWKSASITKTYVPNEFCYLSWFRIFIHDILMLSITYRNSIYEKLITEKKDMGNSKN